MSSSKKQIRIKLPTSWNDLSERQLSKLALLFHNGFAERSRTAEILFDLKVWFILRDIRWWQFLKAGKNIAILNNVAISELKNSYSFIYDTNNRTNFVQIIKNNKGEIHFPPLPSISNLSVQEFAMDDDLHHKYRETKNTEYLQMLTAVLYVKNDGRRPEFIKEILPKLSDSFSKVPVEKLLAIEHTYFGCKNAIVKRFPKAFPKGDGKSNSKPKYGFGKVILSMGHGDLSKNKSISEINVYTFLEQFQQDIMDAKENKK